MSHVRHEAVTPKLALVAQRRSILTPVAGVSALRMIGNTPDNCSGPRITGVCG